MSGAGVALAEAIASFLLVVGAVFGLVGSWGLAKLPDLITRLHAPTKATTLGVGGVLMASMVYFWGVEGVFSWHEILIALFLFLTAPISANMIAKAWMHDRGAALALPDTGRPCGWANDDTPRDSDDAPPQA
jgi:multicomponent K+:H+ antiporter subunit G